MEMLFYVMSERENRAIYVPNFIQILQAVLA